MPDEAPSPEVEYDHLLVCLHCRKRKAERRMSGANLCPACIAKRVRPRYDMERSPEHVDRQAAIRARQATEDRTLRSNNRREQDRKRNLAAAKIAEAKAAPKPVKAGSQLRAEARERAQTAGVS